MCSSLWTCFILLSSLVFATFAANPRTPVDVPFGRNYVPTWAYDHIKYLNGGSEIQLNLDKYTGIFLFFFTIVFLII
jgi:xyloglucan:xyloglucosyl transferase